MAIDTIGHNRVLNLMARSLTRTLASTLNGQDSKSPIPENRDDQPKESKPRNISSRRVNRLDKYKTVANLKNSVGCRLSGPT